LKKPAARITRTEVIESLQSHQERNARNGGTIAGIPLARVKLGGQARKKIPSNRSLAFPSLQAPPSAIGWLTDTELQRSGQPPPYDLSVGTFLSNGNPDLAATREVAGNAMVRTRTGSRSLGCCCRADEDKAKGTTFTL